MKKFIESVYYKIIEEISEEGILREKIYDIFYPEKILKGVKKVLEKYGKQDLVDKYVDKILEKDKKEN